MNGLVPANDGTNVPPRKRGALKAVPLLQQALDILDAAHVPAEIGAYIQTAMDSLEEYLATR